MTTATQPEYLTTDEVAATLRKSRDYVSRQCSAGRTCKARACTAHLHGKKLGNEWRIHRDELARFMSGGSALPTRPERQRAR